MDWTDQQIAVLREAWDEGLSCAAIGRKLGVSANSIVGKAHRINLPARPSPIYGGPRTGPRKPPPPVRTPAKKTLPPLPSLAVAPPPPPPPTPRLTSSHGPPCCWPIGHPGTKAFRYCDDPSEPGKPYCLNHCKLAYRAA